MTICAIHQPNFFPWAGYFDKINQADIFIFLDEVACPRTSSGSWCNRVKLLNGNEPSWFGLPIKRESGVQLIKNIEFANKDYNTKKIFKSLQHNYKKSSYYEKAISLIEPLLMYPVDNLVEYNINAITTLSNRLGLQTKFVRQSELSHSQHATSLLIELAQQVGADTYLCGNGAQGYQEDTLFAEAGIHLQYQNKKPVQNFIKDLNSEEASLSILHLLMLYYDKLV